MPVWRVMMTNLTFNVGNLFDERLPSYSSFRLDDKISFCRNEKAVKRKNPSLYFETCSSIFKINCGNMIGFCSNKSIVLLSSFAKTPESNFC